MEISAPFFIGLPREAVAPPPQGPLGFGGSYRAANGEQDGSVFLKQAAVTWKGLGSRSTNLRLGRFEFVEGVESLTQDPTLDWIKREPLRRTALLPPLPRGRERGPAALGALTSLTLYLAHATGGRTVSAIHPGSRQASFGYLEVPRRF